MKNIMLCIDLKNSNKDIINEAIKIAKKDGAKIVIINVKGKPIYNANHVTGKKSYPIKARQLYVENYQLQYIVNAIRDEGISCDAIRCSGKIADEIIKNASKNNIDLILMGAKQNSSIKHLILGSIPGKVMKKIKLPVLLIPIISNNLILSS